MDMTSTEENAPVEAVADDKPKGKGGKRKFTITDASRDYERALATLAKVSKSDEKVEKAGARLEKAQAAYDAAVAEAPDNTDAKAAAQLAVDETKAKLDALVLAVNESD